MSSYFDNPNPALNPQQPSDLSVMSGSYGLRSVHLAGGSHELLQPIGTGINLQAPLEYAYADNVESLFQGSDQPGPSGSDVLENLEGDAIQASHGRFELEPFGPLACVECLAVFRNDSKLSKHGKDVGHRPYACLCGKTFTRLFSLTRHLSSRSAASVTGNVGAKHPCPLCTRYDGEQGFNRRDHLLQHVRAFHRFEDNGIAFFNEAANNAAGAAQDA